MTTNEAAERLHALAAWIREHATTLDEAAAAVVEEGQLIRAAERRATVERIQEALGPNVTWPKLLRILDEEAAR